MRYDLFKGLVNSFLEFYNTNGFYGVRKFGKILKEENNDSFYRSLIDLVVDSFERNGYKGTPSDRLREGEEVRKSVMRDFGFKDD